MKIAYFSPLSPLKSGIVDFSEREILPYLSEYGKIDIFIADGYRPSNKEIRFEFNIYNYKKFHEKADEYDITLYNIGNNPQHTYIYEILQKYPGIVILHEAFIHGLIWNKTLARGDKVGYIEEFLYSHGEEGNKVANLAIEGEKTFFEIESKYPLIKRIIDDSLGLIVHNEFAKDIVINQNPEVKIQKINHPITLNKTSTHREGLRKKMGLTNDTLIISSFGFINTHKRMNTMLEVFKEFHEEYKNSIFLIVGEDYLGLKNMVKNLNIKNSVIHTGFVPFDKLYEYMQISDICINLRYPTAGETSGSVLRLMSMEKPVIVSNVGWFSELSDSCCAKVDVDSYEKELLLQYLRVLAANEKLRKKMGRNAREYVRREHNPQKIANEYLEFIHKIIDGTNQNDNRNINNSVNIGVDDDHLITGWVKPSLSYGKNIIYSTETASLFIKKREGDNIWWMRCKSPANKSIEVIFKKDDIEKKYFVNLKKGMNTFQQECNLKAGVYKVYFVGNKLNRIGTINHHINVCFGLKEFRFDNIYAPTTWGGVAEKKRICVVTSQVPFERGGNEYLADFLVQKLNEYGYDACMFYTPQNRHYIFRKLIAGYLSNRFVDLDEYNAKQIHQIISLKYPSFAIKHPNHVCWFNHRQREYYDLWDEWIITETRRFKIIGLKRRVERVIIHKLDSYLLKKNVSLIYSQSKNIKDRLLKWGNIPTEVLYPPPLKNEECYCESYDNYIFTISRLSKLKRLDLLITAFKYVKNKDIKCYIAGKGEDYHLLNDLIEKNKLKDRVKLLGFLSDEDALKYYANCRAVFFGPLNEDYGLVSLEAMKSKKALITCEDSGGPTEFVIDGKTGFIAKADPLNIAQKIGMIADDEEKAKEMGYAAYESVKDITWENTIKKLIIV